MNAELLTTLTRRLDEYAAALDEKDERIKELERLRACENRQTAEQIARAREAIKRAEDAIRSRNEAIQHMEVAEKALQSERKGVR